MLSNQAQQFAPSALGHSLRSCRCALRYVDTAGHLALLWTI